jgi:GT2 family glycosyltransferase
MARVTVAIVTYLSTAELPDCIESVLASTGVTVKAVVIDNSPNDETLTLARQYEAKHPNVVAIHSGGNIGLAAANNLVVPYADGDYILMLNPDTILKPDSISTMVQILDADPKAGVVGPKNVYENGQAFSSYQRAWNLGHVFLWRVLPYSLTRRMYDNWSHYRESKVFYVSGSCLLIRTQLFRDMGGYDPQFFLTIEDVCDLCRRVIERGFSVIFTPRTEIVHYCSRSGDQVPYLAVISGYKGSIYYFKKYNGVIGGFLAYALVTLGCMGKILVSLAKVAVFRRALDRRNLRVYLDILPQLLRRGPAIAYAE